MDGSSLLGDWTAFSKWLELRFEDETNPKEYPKISLALGRITSYRKIWGWLKPNIGTRLRVAGSKVGNATSFLASKYLFSLWAHLPPSALSMQNLAEKCLELSLVFNLIFVCSKFSESNYSGCLVCIPLSISNYKCMTGIQQVTIGLRILKGLVSHYATKTGKEPEKFMNGFLHLIPGNLTYL